LLEQFATYCPLDGGLDLGAMSAERSWRAQTSSPWSSRRHRSEGRICGEGRVEQANREKETAAAHFLNMSVGRSQHAARSPWTTTHLGLYGRVRTLTSPSDSSSSFSAAPLSAPSTLSPRSSSSVQPERRSHAHEQRLAGYPRTARYRLATMTSSSVRPSLTIRSCSSTHCLGSLRL
jgi:hypothetical protein